MLHAQGNEQCNARMAWWLENNLEGPMKLFNRDNSAAAALGGDAARERAS